MPTLPPLPPTIRTLTNVESQQLEADHGGLPGPEQCLTCGGSGSFRWWSPGKREDPVEWECSCVDQWILRRYLLHSGVGLNYARLGWLDYAGAPEGSKAAADWLEDVNYTMTTGIGLTLYGTHGTGKTLIGTLLLKGMIAKGYSGFMTTLSGMVDMLTGGWKDPDARQRFVSLCKGSDVLLLDDVGQERHDEKAWWDHKTQTRKVSRTSQPLVRASLDEVLRYRLANAKVTIITTNLDPYNDFGAGYSDALASLVNERSVLCHLGGQDFRATSMEQRLRRERELRLIRPVVLA